MGMKYGVLPPTIPKLSNLLGRTKVYKLADKILALNEQIM
jgi:hypothetical protein